MARVYVVQHVHSLESGEEDVKFIGVYVTREDAHAAIARMSLQPGFMDYADEFSVDEYELNKDHWEEGFVAALEPESVKA